MEEYGGPGQVAWEEVCTPKKYGGLGIQKICQWNVAAVGKYVWDITLKKDSLFVKWVNSVYLNGQEWWDYQAPKDSSWYWRKIVAVKENLKSKIDLIKFCQQKYTIKSGYQLLFTEKGSKVQWCNSV